MIKSMLKNQRGQGLAEYALIIAVVSVAIVAALAAFREDIVAVFENIGGTLQDPEATGGST